MKHQTIDDKINNYQNVLISGGGGIGSAAGLMIREWGDFADTIYIGDANIKAARNAVDWIKEGSDKNGKTEAFHIPLEGTSDEFNKVLEKSDIVLDCLPGSQAPRIAKLAIKNNAHYANLTEYVKETNEIMEMARGVEVGVIPQTGLAPGFINVLANHLQENFCEDYEVCKIDDLSMKVGALGKSAVGPHFYSFTWSPIGVATEYLEPATVIRDFKKTERPSLTERSKIVIDGVAYEEALTSGGTANLPDALEGKVRNLDYKTLRYPGHYDWIDGLLKEIPEGNGRAEKLQTKMQEFVPRSEDDLVVIYSSAKGKDKENNLRVLEKSYRIEPVKVGNKNLRAIQATTASSLAEIARMLATGNYAGLIPQSEIVGEKFEKFINGKFVSRVYK